VSYEIHAGFQSRHSSKKSGKKISPVRIALF
jgi:hypothetical protein